MGGRSSPSSPAAILWESGTRRARTEKFCTRWERGGSTRGPRARSGRSEPVDGSPRRRCRCRGSHRSSPALPPGGSTAVAGRHGQARGRFKADVGAKVHGALRKWVNRGKSFGRLAELLILGPWVRVAPGSPRTPAAAAMPRPAEHRWRFGAGRRGTVGTRRASRPFNPAWPLRMILYRAAGERDRAAPGAARCRSLRAAARPRRSPPIRSRRRCRW